MNSATNASPVQSIHRHHDEPFPSPLFRDVTDRFSRSKRRVILEPGQTSEGMLSLMAGKRCRLLVADAMLALDALSGQSSDADYLKQRVTALLPDGGGEPIDAFLCWDLLNYLSPPLLGALAARLIEIMAPTGIVHAYIHAGHAMMPAHPQRYALIGADHAVCVSPDTANRKIPRYSAWDLEKHGKGLRVERSVMLRNGLQEYILRLDPSRSGPREVKPLYKRPQDKA